MIERVGAKPYHGKFESLEIGRGVAAILVVIYHAANNIAEPRFFDQVIYDGRLGNFNVGIDFFFVLSGFIIAWIHWDDIGKADRLGSYAKKRFIRIYPPYWGILLPLAALYYAFPSAGKATQHDPANLFFSITLLPYKAQPILGAAWTLVYEVMFYAVFGLIIWLGRRAAWLFPLWAGVVLAALPFEIRSVPASFLLSVFNLEFLLGIATARVLRGWSVARPSVWLACGLAGFVGGMLFAPGIQDHGAVARACFGLSAAAIILGLVELERSSLIKAPAALRLLGSASYSIYLIHGVVLSMVIQVVTRAAGREFPLTLVLAIMVLSGIAAGCVYHLLVERPLLAALRKILLDAPTASARSAATGPDRPVQTTAASARE